ncbi:hypothetical protein BD410DRAFT_835929 [Rickenella mellea]|uniref:Uncharacterized protein n=1 Tax=Rickenella mellea TaxID=50990 RepID=A0A4Y7QHS6_9AGAM|nr:hypothetical protein BD410DRAFT_835929 [Rickenella mellea]
MSLSNETPQFQGGEVPLKQKGKATCGNSVPRNYGATGDTGAPAARSSSGESLERVPEEEAPLNDAGVEEETWDDDSDEEEVGLSPNEYKRLALLHALVPLIAALVFVALVVLPFLVWPPSHPPSALRLVSAVVLSAAIWSLSHALRVPLYKFSDLITFWSASETLTTALSTFLLVLFQESLRLSSFFIFNLHQHLQRANPHPPSPPYDVGLSPYFHEAWFLALGWALAEVIAGITQTYDQLALYREVPSPLLPLEDSVEVRFFPDEPERESPVVLRRTHLQEWPSDQNIANIAPTDVRPDGAFEEEEEAEESLTVTMNGNGNQNGQMLHKGFDVEQELDSELSRLVNIKGRAELEEVYGIPFVDIPVFILLLQRVDSIVLSFGLTLLLSSAFCHPLSTAHPSIPHTNPLSHRISLSSFSTKHASPNDNHYLIRMFLIVTTIHTLLSALHSPLILPRIGVHTAGYISLLIGLGTVFAGLGVWGALS